MLGGCWCNIVLNVPAPNEKSGDPKYIEVRYENSIRDFNAKVERHRTFIPSIWNESLHQDSNDNVVRILKLPHQEVNFLIARCSTSG